MEIKNFRGDLTVIPAGQKPLVAFYSFQMSTPSGEKAGPPPVVKKVLSMFGSGKEEDRLVGYLSFLKIGPKLLKFVPGKKAKDLRNWCATMLSCSFKLVGMMTCYLGA